jgi:hypothetical protein
MAYGGKWLEMSQALMETVMEPQLQEPLIGSEEVMACGLTIERGWRGLFNLGSGCYGVVVSEKRYLEVEQSGRY